MAIRDGRNRKTLNLGASRVGVVLVDNQTDSDSTRIAGQSTGELLTGILSAALLGGARFEFLLRSPGVDASNT